MNNKNKALLANVFLAAAVALSLTAVVAIFTDVAWLKWSRSIIPISMIFVLGATLLRKEAGKDR